MSFDSEAQHLLKRARVLSERAHAYSAKYSMDADTISSEILSLHTAIREYLKATPNDAVARQAERVIKGHEGPGGDLRRLLPLKHRRPVSFFVRMFTGDRLKLHMVAPEDAQAFKEEYHRFRDATAIFFTLYPALVLALDLATGGTFHPRDLFTVPPAAVPPGPPPSPLVTLACQVLVAAMLYFYVALSIREGILQVNGSNVRAWWYVDLRISRISSGEVSSSSQHTRPFHPPIASPGSCTTTFPLAPCWCCSRCASRRSPSSATFCS